MSTEVFIFGGNYGCFRLFLLWAEILEGYKAITIPSEEEKKSQRSLYAQLEAVADMKFTYVATCQNYGNQKRSGDRRATDILNLMVKYVLLLMKLIDLCNLISLKILILHEFCSRIWFTNFLFFIFQNSNPSLRVAYIDEVEERESGKVQKVYYSVLVKAVDYLDQVIVIHTVNRTTILIYKT